MPEGFQTLAHLKENARKIGITLALKNQVEFAYVVEKTGIHVLMIKTRGDESHDFYVVVVGRGSGHLSKTTALPIFIKNTLRVPDNLVEKFTEFCSWILEGFYLMKGKL